MENIPDEEIKQIIIDYFLIKVIGASAFLISKESYASDFLPFLDIYGKQQPNGEWEFDWNMIDLDQIEKDFGRRSILGVPKKSLEKYTIIKKIKMKDDEVVKLSDLIKKTQELFNVTVYGDFIKKSLDEIADEIYSKISPTTKKELVKNHDALINENENEGQN